MKATRRDLLKGISGVAVAATAGSVFVNGDECQHPLVAKQPCPAGPLLPTVVVVNGSFGFLFNQATKELVAFVPNFDPAHHLCRVDDITIGQPCGTPDVHLNVTPDPKGVRGIEAYKCNGEVFRPDKYNFPFDDSQPTLVKVHLPYASQIYPHRVLGAFLTNSSVAVKTDMSGALALLYPTGMMPSIPELPGYCAYNTGDEYYLVVFSAENPDIQNTPPVQHAQDAWEGLKKHFKGMNWQLVLPLGPIENAKGPYDVTDKAIEAAYPPSTITSLLKKFQGKTVEEKKFVASGLDMVARAANCKSPLFVAELT